MNDQYNKKQGTALTKRISTKSFLKPDQKQGLLQQPQTHIQHKDSLEPCVRLLQGLLQFLLKSEQALKNKNLEILNNKHQPRINNFEDSTRKRSIKQNNFNNKRQKLIPPNQHKEYTANANENNDNATISSCTQSPDDSEISTNNIYFNKDHLESFSALPRTRRKSYNTNPLSYFKLGKNNESDTSKLFQNHSDHIGLASLDLNANIFHKNQSDLESDLISDNFLQNQGTDDNLLRSPPRRIPRLKLGSSVFDQARLVADRKKSQDIFSKPLATQSKTVISRVKSAPPCFNPYTSQKLWDQKQDIGTTRTASRFQQRLPDINNFALNSNANAATGCRPPSWLANHQFDSVSDLHSTSSRTIQDTVLQSAVDNKNVTGLFDLPFRCVSTTSPDTKSSVRRKTTLERVTLPQIATNNKLNNYLVNKNKSDTSLTKENAARLRQKRAFIKVDHSSKPQHFELLESHSRVDKDIAASVRCFCRISSSVDICGNCQNGHSISNTANKAEGEEETFNSLSATARPKVLNQLENSNEYKLRKSSSQAQQKSYTTSHKDRTRQISYPSSSKSEVQTSFNNRYSSEASSSSSASNLHCCDAFCLLFGGSHSNNLSASFVFGKLLHAAQSASPKRSSTLGILTPERSDMGCFHSVSNKSRVGPCRTNICSEVQATIDQSPTVIEEYSPIVLRYRTPYFRASAQVIMPPIRKRETWTVGWIQACDYMKFINQYGNLGCSSWEIPALKSGKIPAVSDSDGVSYPWYGNTTEIATIVGPTDNYRRMNLTMNDNFYPSVTWDIPVSEGTNAHLTRIVRDQSFITWLAAINETTKDIIVLKTVRWNFYLEIDIDPTRELGQRARIVAPRVQKQPLVTNGPCEKSRFNSSPVRSKRRGIAEENNSNSAYVGQIPISALVKPSANNAQTLIWRPARSQPIIVVPAKEQHKDTNELVLFSGSSVMQGKESIVKEITKQEMIQLQQLAR